MDVLRLCKEVQEQVPEAFSEELSELHERQAKKTDDYPILKIAPYDRPNSG